MQKSDDRSSGGYGSYGGYYYGEGYGGGYAESAATPSRGLKDYLIILRERIWWLVTTVFVVFLGVALYTFNSPELFRSFSTVQILRMRENPLATQGSTDEFLRTTEDLQTQINILESQKIVQGVDKRIQGAFRRLFTAPYES